MNWIFHSICITCLAPLIAANAADQSETVLEAETLSGVTFTGSARPPAKQDMTGFPKGKWSGGAQLWFRGKKSDVLTIPFEVEQAGDYELSAAMTKAPDYGTFTLTLNATPTDAGTIDLYGPDVIQTGEIALGTHPLAAGQQELKVEVTGQNPLSKGTFFGLDFIRLRPAAKPSPGAMKLTALRTAYEVTYQGTAGDTYQAALKDLNAKYTATLDRALAETSRLGNLDDAVILRDERALIAANLPLPPVDAPVPGPLKELRQAYRGALAQVEAARDRASAPLKANYSKSLELLQAELTKSGDLEAAVAARKERERLIAEVAAKPSPLAPPAAGSKMMVVNSPPATIPGPSGSTAVTVDNLQGRRVIFGMIRDRDLYAYGLFTLMKNGRLFGTLNTNENLWDIDSKERVRVLAADGRVSTIYSRIRWKEGRVRMEGEFQFKNNVTHILDEVTPIPLADAALSTRRIAGRRFEFCYATDRSNGNHHRMVFDASGKIMQEAEFGVNFTWKIDSEGRLVVMEEAGRLNTIYDQAYTFDDGNRLMLEGPFQKRVGVTHRVIEQRN
jgi:hypothetical protein